LQVVLELQRFLLRRSLVIPTKAEQVLEDHHLKVFLEIVVTVIQLLFRDSRQALQVVAVHILTRLVSQAVRVHLVVTL
jgi:hypothetical protein